MLRTPYIKGELSQIFSIPLNSQTTVETRFLKPPREAKIGLRNWEVREIESKITEKFIQGKRKLVREIGRFEKLKVPETRIPLYIFVSH